MIPDVHNFHFWDIVDGTHDEAYQNGYGVVLAHTSLDRERESETLRGLIERRYDGVILATTFSEQSPIEMRALIKQGGAVVTLGRDVGRRGSRGVFHRSDRLPASESSLRSWAPCNWSGDGRGAQRNSRWSACKRTSSLSKTGSLSR